MRVVEKFLCSTETKDKQVGGVTFEEAPGFLSETEEPLGTDDLHPTWGAFHGSGKEVDGRADANADWNPCGEVVAGNPFLLFGATEGNQEHVGLGRPNAGADVLIGHLVERSKGRRASTDDAEIRVF